MADEQGSERSFKVQDRRRFTAGGEARPEAAESEEAPQAAAEAPAAEAPSEPQGDRPAPGEVITFPTFLLGLSTQALVHLGEIPNPVDQSTHVDLDGARQIIDILALLRDKTRGNLDAGESALLETALYDLRMKFVDRAKRS